MLEGIHALGEPKPVFIFVFIRIEVGRLAGGISSGLPDIALIYCVSLCLILIFFDDFAHLDPRLFFMHSIYFVMESLPSIFS
jgi:hypothetical protein